MPRPRLPPLPPPAVWNEYFPRRYLSHPPDPVTRQFGGRILLAGRKLADEFVRALRLRPDEVVVEVNAGPGQLTRSLLAGGQKEVVKPWSAEEIDASRDAWKGVTMPKLDSPARGSGTKLPEGFPLWRNELSEGRTLDKHDEEDKAAEHREGAVTTETASAAETASASAINKPALVVASESSAQIIMRGLGFPAELVPFKGLMLERLSEAAILDDMTSAGVYQSPLDPRLALSLSTPYRWPVLPRILSSPIVAKHLPIYDPEAPPGTDTTKRPWEADPPPLTIVGHIPNSLNGEQMLAQWVGSSVGEAGTPRSWIWEWGRVRLALLVGKSLYDRMMAQPGEITHCKLSVLTAGLFDVRALPPYHHVPNVDKSSTLTETADHVRSKPSRARSGTPAPPPPPFDTLGLVRTKTYRTDFFPPPANTGGMIEPLPRPAMMGILLEPKRDSVVTLDQKDAWDYVLRRCFIKEASSIGEALKNVGFGGEVLATRLNQATGYRGRALDPKKIVRNLDVDEWARVVDVFDKWAFKPENLILDSRGEDDLNREIGQD